MLRKIISLALSFGLLFQQTSFAQVAPELNIANLFSRIGSNIAQEKFRPLHLRYFSYDNLNDNFKILLDKGDLKNLKAPELESSTKTLLSYFLIGVTLPDEMFWVNLRPDPEDQIIDSYLGKTDVGKIMLEADLQLKKDTALFTSPQTPQGKEYWEKLYKKASELYANENIEIPTLTRPWIVPGEIIVRESKDSAYVYKANLKVMLEQDYLKNSDTYNFKDERAKDLNKYSSQLIRELIIPKLTKEVNSSKRYAPLRQVYYSLILSRWFKLRFTGKTGTYASLINTKDLTNLTSLKSWSQTDYFKQYQKSFAKGEYNIQEPVYAPTGQIIRNYFSGGINIADGAINTQNGIFVPNDNVNKLGDIIQGKAVVDLRNINLSQLDGGRTTIEDAFKIVENGIMTQNEVCSKLKDIYNSGENRDVSTEKVYLKRESKFYNQYIQEKKIKVAIVNGEIVGYALFDSDAFKSMSQLYELYVAKDWQLKGVGSALMDSAIAVLRKAGGLREIVFYVEESAVGFYREYFRNTAKYLGEEIDKEGFYVFDGYMVKKTDDPLNKEIYSDWEKLDLNFSPKVLSEARSDSSPAANKKDGGYQDKDTFISTIKNAYIPDILFFGGSAIAFFKKAIKKFKLSHVTTPIDGGIFYDDKGELLSIIKDNPSSSGGLRAFAREDIPAPGDITKVIIERSAESPNVPDYISKILEARFTAWYVNYESIDNGKGWINEPASKLDTFTDVIDFITNRYRADYKRDKNRNDPAWDFEFSTFRTKLLEYAKIIDKSGIPLFIGFTDDDLKAAKNAINSPWASVVLDNDLTAAKGAAINKHLPHSIKNIIFYAILTKNGFKDYKRSLLEFARLAGGSESVLDEAMLSSQEINGVELVAKIGDGNYLCGQEEITQNVKEKPIQEFFFANRDDIRKYIQDGRKSEISPAKILPSINTQLTDKIREMDESNGKEPRDKSFIVFGPGSQFSSVLVHLKIPGVIQALADTKNTPRVLILNPILDYETYDMGNDYFRQIIGTVEKMIKTELRDDNKDISAIFDFIVVNDKTQNGEDVKEKATNENLENRRGKQRLGLIEYKIDDMKKALQNKPVVLVWGNLLEVVNNKVTYTISGMEALFKAMQKFYVQRHQNGSDSGLRGNILLASDLHATLNAALRFKMAFPDAPFMVAGDPSDRGHNLHRLLRLTDSFVLGDHELWAIAMASGVSDHMTTLYLRMAFNYENDDLLEELRLDKVLKEARKQPILETWKNIGYLSKESDSQKAGKLFNYLFTKLYFEEMYNKFNKKNKGERKKALIRLSKILAQAYNPKRRIFELPEGDLKKAVEDVFNLHSDQETNFLVYLYKARSAAQDKKDKEKKAKAVATLADSATGKQWQSIETKIADEIYNEMYDIFLKNPNNNKLSLMTEQESAFLKDTKGIIAQELAETHKLVPLKSLIGHFLKGPLFRKVQIGPQVPRTKKLSQVQFIDPNAEKKILIMHVLPPMAQDGSGFVDMMGKKLPEGKSLNEYYTKLNSALEEVRKGFLEGKPLEKMKLFAGYKGNGDDKRISTEEWFIRLADTIYAPLFAREQRRIEGEYVDKGDKEPDNIIYDLLYQGKIDKKKIMNIFPGQDSENKKSEKIKSNLLSKWSELKDIEDIFIDKDSNIILQDSGKNKIVLGILKNFGLGKDALLVVGHQKIEENQIAFLAGGLLVVLDAEFAEKGGKTGALDNTQKGVALLRSEDGKKRAVKLISMNQVFSDMTSFVASVKGTKESTKLFNQLSEKINFDYFKLEEVKKEVIKNFSLRDIEYYDVSVSLDDIRKTFSGGSLEKIKKNKNGSNTIVGEIALFLEEIAKKDKKPISLLTLDDLITAIEDKGIQTLNKKTVEELIDLLPKRSSLKGIKNDKPQEFLLPLLMAEEFGSSIRYRIIRVDTKQNSIAYNPKDADAILDKLLAPALNDRMDNGEATLDNADFSNGSILDGGANSKFGFFIQKDSGLAYPYSAFSIPLINDEVTQQAIENHVLLVQVGKAYKEGKAVDIRLAALTNSMWTDLLKDKDTEGLKLHQEKLRLTEEYTVALKVTDFKIAREKLQRYVEIRDSLCHRWLSLAIDAKNGKKDLPPYAYEYAKKAFQNKDYELVNKFYDQYKDDLKNMSLYTWGPIGELVEKAKAEEIALFPLGAGGPGANVIAVSEHGSDYIAKFLKANGIDRIDEDQASAIIHGDGNLKGYLPFKIGMEPMKITGFDQLKQFAVNLPEGPKEGVFDQTTGRVRELKDGETINPADSDLIKGKLFMTSIDPATNKPINFDQGKPLSDNWIKNRVRLNAKNAREILQFAKDNNIALEVIAHLRGVDGAGSSLDLPQFQMDLTKENARMIVDLPSTPTITSEFEVKISFELSDHPEAIEYIAPDYTYPSKYHLEKYRGKAIDEVHPYIKEGEVKLAQGKTSYGQLDGPAFIFSNIFGLKGVKITCGKMPPMALAGGMESSNAFNVALISAASMLSGADLSYADIFNLAVKLENDEFNGLTGGQGHLSSMLGGAYQHVWLSGIKNVDGGNNLNILLVQAEGNLNKTKAKFKPEASDFLKLLTERKDLVKEGLEVEPFIKKEVDNVNPVILLLGSPSPEAFRKAVLDWINYKKDGFKKIFLIASTGRGRGYQNFILMTLKFLKEWDKNKLTNLEERFIELCGQQEIEDVKNKTMDELDAEYYSYIINPSTEPELAKVKMPNPDAAVEIEFNYDGNFNNKYSPINEDKIGQKLTEAKAIKYIMKIFLEEELNGDVNKEKWLQDFEDSITLEELSNDTNHNVYQSLIILEDLKNKGGFIPMKPLKIQLVAASFHRLRALLTFVRISKLGDDKSDEWKNFFEGVRRDKNPKINLPEDQRPWYKDGRAKAHKDWQVFAKDSEEANLEKMDEETFYEYFKQSIGEGIGEIEKIRSVFFWGALQACSTTIKERLEKDWNKIIHGDEKKRSDELRVKLKEYLRAYEEVKRLKAEAEKSASKDGGLDQSTPAATGGIDFRALPMVIQPMGSFSNLNFKLPQLSQSRLEQINVASEVQQIKNLVQSGITPSGDRLKEVIAACIQKKEISSQIDNLLVCLGDIFKQEEESASESSPELREALAIVDSQIL